MTNSSAGRAFPGPHHSSLATEPGATGAPPFTAMVCVDRSGRCLYADVAFCQAFSLKPIGLDDALLTHAELPAPLAAAASEAIGMALASGEVGRGEAKLIEAERERRVVVHALPERGWDGAISALSLLVSNAAQTQPSSPASLQHALAPPASAASEQARQRAARAQAEVAVFARDRVLSILSHDLRGPLNAIHSWAHVLERKISSDDPGTQRALAGIRTGVEQQVKLIEDVVDTARAGTKNLTLSRQKVEPDRILREVISNLREGFAATRAAALVCEPEPRGGGILAEWDPERVWQALWTALAFAVDASAAGALVRVASRTDEGQWQLAIAYQAAPEVLTGTAAAHAFEAFVRADAVRPQAAGQACLPLFLPQRVAEAHGGHLKQEALAASDVGDGDGSGDLRVITLFLPLTAPAPAEPRFAY